MSSSPRGALRTGIALATALLTTAAVAPAAEAHDEPDRRAKAIGASWLNKRFDEGLLYAGFFDFESQQVVTFVDYGTTVEAGYALDAVGRTKLLPTVTAALADDVDSYITGADFSAPDDFSAGSTGKLLSYVADLGGDADPTSFGGTDLVERMELLTTDDGADAGRIADHDAEPFACGAKDDPVPCDWANLFGQMWATHGLLAVDSPEGPAALDFLLSRQCEDGSYLTFFDDVCGESSAGPDATALFVILLSEFAESDPDLEDALDRAVAVLSDAQRKNGSFADDNGVSNSNSTGLAGWALAVAGKDQAARRAAVWLRSLQVPGRSCDGALSRHRGAIAYNKGAYRAGREKGIDDVSQGEWHSVAAQALPVLAHAPSTHVKLAVDAPEKVKANGRKVKVKVKGLAQGERACVGIGKRTVVAVGRAEGKTVVVKIPAPKKAGKPKVKVLTANKTASDKIVAKR